MDEYRSVLSAQLVAAQAEHARRRQNLDRAERDFQEAPDDERRYAANQRDACSHRYYVSGTAVQELGEALTNFSFLSSRFTETTSRLRLQANQRLTFLDEALSLYAFETTTAVNSAKASRSTELGNQRPENLQVSPLDRLLAARGMRMIPVDRADFTDNPILSWRTDVANYLWACEKWDLVVSNAVSHGQNREDLAKRDTLSGAPNPSMRQLAHVWDLFLGGDPIDVTAKPDGSFEVNGGRHRLEAARRLGISHLPAVVRGGN
ncbi:ParB N-terminal domain-containing protein [Arthrobacter sp. ISL-69]|uniref:ParB N-terminal domain-containing protein n=1 Tax=Arthrobacter sp. ISL-69 TaxID=2819113 RepID=UPI001BE9B4D8|nr:ParB N-terminal domain-containing protein [Arthrobacter sp. ISL-69]MBT2536280.1 ParB N-terminal domain-containing protein [Arthrobacter sp. ISL-69]